MTMNISEDKFGGPMEFGSCMTNSVFKLINMTDIDGKIIKVPCNNYDQPVGNLIHYYLKEYTLPNQYKGCQAVLESQDGHVYSQNSEQKIKDIKENLRINFIQSKKLILANVYIKIQLPFGNSIKISLINKIKVFELKEQLCKQRKYLNMNNFRLVYEGKQLPSAFLLIDLDVKKDITLKLQINETINTFTIRVKMITGKTITLQCNQHYLIEDIHAMVAAKTQFSREQQQLMFAGQCIQYGTLKKYGITKQSTLELFIRMKEEEADYFSFSNLFISISSYFFPKKQAAKQGHINIQVILENNQKIFIEFNKSQFIVKLKEVIREKKKIPIENIELSYNSKHLKDNKLLSDYECELESTELIIRLKVLNPNQVFGNQLFLLSVKTSKATVEVKVKRQFTIFDLKKILLQQTKLPVKNQSLWKGNLYLREDKSLAFYQIHPFSLIQMHELSFQVQISLKNRKLILQFNQSLPIYYLLTMVEPKYSINGYCLKLHQNGYEIDHTLSFKEQGLTNYCISAKVMSQQFGKNHLRLFNSKIIIQMGNHQSAEMNYNLIRSWTVAQTIKSVISRPQSFYCLMFGNILLEPFDQIKKIEKSLQFVDNEDFTLIVLKSSEKLQFYKNINLKSPFPSEYFKLDEEISKLRKDSIDRIISSDNFEIYKEQEFYTPIQYYTCSKFYRPINSFLENIEYSNSDIFQSHEASFVSALVRSLNQLPDYQGDAHRVIKNIRFSQFQKAGDCFYWKGFTSASTRQDIVRRFLCKNGSLFHIKSLRGKNISEFSVYEHQQQVLFYPFTYFIAERIERKQEYDEIWLSQMPTPVGLVKNILIWVDDIPQNNRYDVQSIREKGVEVIQLTSTLMAKKWTSQFSWLLNWMDVKFKVISDMVRVENGVNNYYAGIDLLENFYNIRGYSTPILIYCGNPELGKQNAQKRKITGSSIYKITNQQQDVKNYVEFQ